MSHNESKAYSTSHKTAVELGRDPDRDKRRFDPLLDRQTERHPILDALMDQALRRILLTADGATTSLRADVVHGGEDGKGKAPRSGLAIELNELGMRYVAAKTHRARLAVIKDAQEAGDALAFAPDRSKVRGTREWREKVAADPRSTRQTAVVFGISHMMVARIRKDLG